MANNEVREKEKDTVFILRLLSPFKSLMEKSGVDFEKLNSILKIKAILDYRKRKLNEANNEVTMANSNNYLSIMTINGIMGVIFSFVVYIMPTSIQIQQSLFNMILIFTVIMQLISSSSDSLISISDKELIMSRNVNEITYNFAKFLHTAVFVLVTAYSFQAANVLIGTIKYGIAFGLITILATLFVGIFSLSIVIFMYMGIFKYFDGDKLREVTTNINLFISILLGVGSQLAVRVIDPDMFVNAVSNMKIDTMSFFMPNVWFSSFVGYFLDGNRSRSNIILMIISLVVPIALFLLYYVNAEKFEKNLAKVSGGTKLKSHKFDLKQSIGKVITKSGFERTFYNFTNTIMKREDTVKRIVLSQISLGILFPIMMIFNFLKSPETMSEIGFEIHIIMYMFIFFGTQGMMSMMYSPNYKNAWIYEISGLDSTVEMLRGATKAYLIRWLIVPVILLGIALMFLFDNYTVVTFMNSLCLLYILAVLNQRIFIDYPIFSIENQVSSGKGVSNFFMLLAEMFLYVIIFGINIAFILFLKEWYFTIVLVIFVFIADRYGYKNLYEVE